MTNLATIVALWWWSSCWHCTQKETENGKFREDENK